MIEWVNSWVQNIVLAVVICTIIEMILPNGSIKKYIKIVISTYIVFVIISPIVTKISGKKINLDLSQFSEFDNNKIESIETSSYIETTYINTMKQEIIKSIESKGFNVNNIEIIIDNQDENYGEILKANLNISQNTSQNIEPVVIDINKQNSETKVISNNEIEELKTYLKNSYGIQNIIINEGE